MTPQTLAAAFCAAVCLGAAAGVASGCSSTSTGLTSSGVDELSTYQGNLSRCEAAGRDAGDGQHVATYCACLADAGQPNPHCVDGGIQ